MIATLWPRRYIANDDIGFTKLLRQGAFVPWISPILSRTLSWAYARVDGVPWYGLYLYGLVVYSGAVLFHALFEQTTMSAPSTPTSTR